MKAEINPEAGLRLRVWRKASGLKLQGLAEIVKVSQGSLSEIETGKSLPSTNTLVNLWSFTNVNIIWLLTGEGSMLKSSIQKNDNSELGEALEHFVDLMGDRAFRALILIFFKILQGDDKRKKILLKSFLMGLS